jgi:hypothetical protein
MNTIYHNPSKEQIRILEDKIHRNYYLKLFLKDRLDESLEADKDIRDSMNKLISNLEKENDEMIVSRSKGDEPKIFYRFDAGHSFFWYEINL